MSAWQLIETAPETADVSPIWVWLPSWRFQTTAWHDEGQWWAPARENGRMRIPPPSHWMPIPAPPVEPATGGGAP